MTRCKYCGKTIPDKARFCPYCGKQGPISGFFAGIEELTSKVKEKIEENIPKMKRQAYEILDKLSSEAKRASLPNFVNREKVISVLNDVKAKLDTETDKTKMQEYSDWVTLIEQSISGENCIICYTPFEFHGDEKLSVSLCPSCHYAGHTHHFESWLEKKPVCPMCKASISKTQLVEGELYLKDGEIVFSSAEKEI